MRAHNFFEKIPLYRKTNPLLDDKQIGILLLIDNIYLEIPNDVKDFRLKYPYFDPKSINGGSNNIKFIEISNSNLNEKEKKKELNKYLNIKLNSIGHEKSYIENKKNFKQYSIVVSQLIIDILKQAKFSQELIDVLSEINELQKCYDIYDLHLLYQKNTNDTIRFSILRKMGLIILLARIDRWYSVNDLDFAIEEIKEAFLKNLYNKMSSNKIYYFWADESYKLNLTTNEQDAPINYIESCKKREKLASKIHDMQIFESKPFSTKKNNEIIHFDIRNKLKENNEVSYKSTVEKMIRKNLEFPNQIHDIIGLKIVVNTTKDVPIIIEELESFLGGSSTRKREKNSFKKFGKRLLNKHSSGEYTVWKAIYDIPIPHPFIKEIRNILKLSKNNQLNEILNEKIEYFKNTPKDFVVEVQIQDLNSYLLSIAKGSIPYHDNLKMTQIKENTFYKLFPIEIYKKELWELKNSILNNENIK